MSNVDDRRKSRPRGAALFYTINATAITTANATFTDITFVSKVLALMCVFGLSCA